MSVMEPVVPHDPTTPGFQAAPQPETENPDSTGFLLLGESSLTSYWNEGHLSALACAVTSFRSALQLARDGTEEKIKAQIGLADALRLEIDEGSGGDGHHEEVLSLAQSASVDAESFPGLFPDATRALGEVLFDRSRDKKTERLQLAVDAFRRLVDLTIDSRPSDAVKSLALYAQCLNVQFIHTGDSTVLELANATVDRAMALYNSHSLAPSLDLGLAFMIARSLRGNVKGSLDDIDRAIDVGEGLVSSCPPGHPLLAKFWTAIPYNRKASLVGETRDNIERKVHALSEARKRLRPDSSLWHIVNGNYAASLYDRFTFDFNLADLNKSIVIARSVAARVAASSYTLAHSSLFVNNLALVLTVSYAQFGNLDALDEAIALQLDSLNHTSPSFENPVRMSLGQTYRARYAAHGRFTDLEEAMSLQEHVFSHSTPSGPYVFFVHACFELADCLLARFSEQGQLQDVERAISILETAVEHPQQVMNDRLYALLGQAFLKKGTLTQDKHDVEDAIRCQKEALRVFSEAHFERHMSYRHLGLAEYRAFLLDHRPDAIQNSVDAFNQALSLLPADHPSRAAYLTDLATSQLAVAESRGPEALTVVLPTLEDAASHAHSWPSDRYAAAALWARTAHVTGRFETALDAYRLAISILPQVAWMGLEDELRVQRLASQPPDISQDAAACAIELGRYNLAVEIVEASRSILWNTSQELRAELGKLRDVAPDLAQELSQTNAALAFRPSAIQEEKGREHVESERRRIHRLATRRTELLHLVQSIPGFEGFLVPPSYEVLRHVSREGPVVILISSTYRCDALVLQAEKDVAVVPLPKVTHRVILGQTQLVQNLLRSTRDQKGRRFLDQVLQAFLQGLWDKIGEPVWLSLGAEFTSRHLPRLWWCPTGAMTMLPIHACGPYNEKDPNMMDLAVSSYTPTLSALLRSQTFQADLSPPSPPRVLVISQPEFQNRPTLPCALEEARVLYALIPSLCTFSIGPGATVAGIKEMLRHHNWVHVSSHGSQDSSRPLESCIALYDGDLKLSDLAQERIPDAEFAFLSACHSAKGAQSLPDEAMHLAAGMMFAGFKSVVATSWAIADKDAPVVAKAFYKHLIRGGKTPEVTETAEALHVAVKHLRDSGVPLERWIPFIHLGA